MKRKESAYNIAKNEKIAENKVYLIRFKNFNRISFTNATIRHEKRKNAKYCITFAENTKIAKDKGYCIRQKL